MNKKRYIISILIAALLLASAACASTTVWAMNDAAWRVPHSYKGTDWAGYISFGQSFELLETKGNYAKLRNANGNTAWADLEYVPLSYTDPCTLDEMMVAQCDGDLLWPHAAHSLEDPIRLKKGDLVHVVGVTPWKEWYCVEYNGKYYYAPFQLLAENPAPQEGRSYSVEQRYIFGSGVDIHSSPEKKADEFIAYVDDGSVVRLLSAARSENEGLMAKVQTADGATGYIHLVNLIPISLD